MRESTRRIAEGEDPDDVNESLSAPPGANRQMRRNAKKAKAAVDFWRLQGGSDSSYSAEEQGYAAFTKFVSLIILLSLMSNQ